jgi:allophanate hydrolase subunit 1
MTKEEAIEFIAQSVKSDVDMAKVADAIKALEQEPVLDKLRAEIAELDVYYDNDYFSDNRDAMFKCNDVLQILDKYKGESENP